MKRLKILIADDHPLFRHGVKTQFLTTPELEVIGEATSGECHQTCSKPGTRCHFNGFTHARVEWIETTREIVKFNSSIQILILTMFQDDNSVFSGHACRSRE